MEILEQKILFPKGFNLGTKLNERNQSVAVELFETIFLNTVFSFPFFQLGDFYVEINWDFQSWGKVFPYILFVLACLCFNIIENSMSIGTNECNTLTKHSVFNSSIIVKNTAIGHL